jgi:hypothetical protein
MKFKTVLLAITLLAGSLLFQGCALLLVGAAAGVATGGAVSFYGNELQTVQEVTVDKAWTAAQGAVSDLQYQTDTNRCRKDGVKALLFARNAQGQQVVIHLLRQSDRLTEIRVRIGIFDTTSNRQGAQILFDKMRSRM